MNKIIEVANNTTDAVDGKKTYIVSAATIIYAILGILLHFMTIPTAITIIGGMGSIAALRQGVSKVESIIEVVLEALKLINAPKTE